MPICFNFLLLIFLIFSSTANHIHRAGSSTPSLFKKTTQHEFNDEKNEELNHDDIYKSLEAHVHALKKLNVNNDDTYHIKNVHMLFGCLEKDSKYEDCDKIRDFR